MNTSLGVIVTVDEVCQAAAATLEAYLPDALASITDPRTIDPPTSYSQVPTRDAILDAEQSLPAVGLFSTGLSDAPVRDEDGNYTKTWRVTAAGYLRADSFADTQWACRTFGALMQAILVQNKTLGGIAAEVVPVGESYDIVDANASRTLAGVAIDIDVTVQAAFNDLNQPPYPAASYTVITTDTEVTHPALA